MAGRQSFAVAMYVGFLPPISTFMAGMRGEQATGAGPRYLNDVASNHEGSRDCGSDADRKDRLSTTCRIKHRQATGAVEVGGISRAARASCNWLGPVSLRESDLFQPSILKDRPQRSPSAVRERLCPLSRLCTLPHSHESCIKQEAQPLAPGIPHYLGSASKKRARVGLRSREMSVAITRNLSERNRANAGNVL
jgi:hypothetical protein